LLLCINTFRILDFLEMNEKPRNLVEEITCLKRDIEQRDQEIAKLRERLKELEKMEDSKKVSFEVPLSVPKETREKDTTLEFPEEDESQKLLKQVSKVLEEKTPSKTLPASQTEQEEKIKTVPKESSTGSVPYIPQIYKPRIERATSISNKLKMFESKTTSTPVSSSRPLPLPSVRGRSQTVVEAPSFLKQQEPKKEESASAQPKETIKEPIEIIKEPKETIKEPIETIKEPKEIVTEPNEVIKEPKKSIKEPVSEKEASKAIPEEVGVKNVGRNRSATVSETSSWITQKQEEAEKSFNAESVPKGLSLKDRIRLFSDFQHGSSSNTKPTNVRFSPLNSLKSETFQRSVTVGNQD